FAPGMTLPSGPLAFASKKKPEPLSPGETAALAFAACGITGHALAELPYGDGPEAESGGGQIMTHFVARTAPSGDAMHDCTVFVTNDSGTWLLRRPQDYARSDIAGLIADARAGRLEALYEKAGGPLVSDPAKGRTVTLSFLETWICEFVAIEQGAILQNLGLMAAALSAADPARAVGGFPHFAAHPFIWPMALGFRMEQVPLHQ